MRNSIPAHHRRQKKLRGAPAKSGTLQSFTVIRHPPSGFGTDPYTVGLIRHDDGTMSCAQLIADGEKPIIGARVLPRLRNIRTMANGLIVNDYKYEIMETAPEVKLHIQQYVLALTGPSGVGKTTITRMLMTLFSGYATQAPIYTTRPPKKNEVEPYMYITKEEFDLKVAAKEIIAVTHMDSDSEIRHYGYGKADIEAIWKTGKLPLVVTDIHLLKGLADALGRRAILSCGLLPPGNSRRRKLSNLLHRLRGRGRDTEEQILERLKVAEFDLDAFDMHPHLFDHLVVNDELDACVEQISGLMQPAAAR